MANTNYLVLRKRGQLLNQTRLDQIVSYYCEYPEGACLTTYTQPVEGHPEIPQSTLGVRLYLGYDEVTPLLDEDGSPRFTSKRGD